jgi:hypothetical protein
MEDSGRGKLGSRKAGVLDERGEPLWWQGKRQVRNPREWGSLRR